MMICHAYSMFIFIAEAAYVRTDVCVIICTEISKHWIISLMYIISET